MAEALRKMHPRKAREFVENDPLEGRESHATTEGAALIRRLRAGSVHFGHYAFRSTFVNRCLDSGTLAALLGQRYAHQEGEMVLLGRGVCQLRARRTGRQGGASCAGGNRHGDITYVELPALDAAASVSTDHSCNMLGMIFAAHALEDTTTDRLSSEEAELLARTSYGLAYLTQRDCSHIAQTYGAQWPEDAPMSSGCMLGQVEDYPCAGAEEGLLVENAWVIRDRQGPGLGEEAGHFLPAASAWMLHAAYGIVPAQALEPSVGEPEMRAARLRYKRQVAASVQASALSSCDGLLVGCAEGIPGGDVVPGMAAEVWAEVLLGEPGRVGMAAHFRVVAFCLGGRTDPRRLTATREALRAAFSQ